MKHSWIIVTLCSLLIIAGACLMLMPRTVPIDQCSDVYRQYQGREGLEVSFVKQYRVNDTTAVDVTLIHATTDSAWNVLSRKFDIFIIPAEYKKLFEKYNPVDFKLVSKNNPEVPRDKETDTCDLLVTYRKTKSFYIFHLDNINQFNAIVDNKVHELSPQQ